MLNHFLKYKAEWDTLLKIKTNKIIKKYIYIYRDFVMLYQ